MAKRVTDVQLKAWVRQGGPLSAKALGDGLYFRIHKSGVAQFYLRYRFGGKGKWFLLGHYPDMSLSSARDAGRAGRVLVSKGSDPALEKQREQARAQAARTFADVADEWYAREIEPRYKHPEVVERVLRRWIKPKLGRWPIGEVTAIHADAVLRAIVDAGAPTVANDALRYMQRVFKYARKRRLVEINPVADFDLLDAGGVEGSRSRYLTADELRALFSAMRTDDSFGRSNELAAKLLLLLCVRKMELLGARWSNLDLDVGFWYLPHNKTDKPIEIPLPETATHWLRELLVFACGSDYVFPARRITKQRRFPHVGPDTLNRALDSLDLDIPPFTVHDLRRTARTHLVRLGVDKDVAKRCLNHKVPGVDGIYDRHDYFDERRDALELWAAEIESLSCTGANEKSVAGVA